LNQDSKIKQEYANKILTKEYRSKSVIIFISVHQA